MSKKIVGKIEWQDLTVPNASEVKDFYTSVIGWNTEPVSQGDYDDYNVNIESTGETIAGICHNRGYNAEMPAQWMLYVRVASVASSVEAALKLGGKIIDGPKSMGSDDFCVIQDPAGAVIGLVSSKA